jgi:hypothetical protein
MTQHRQSSQYRWLSGVAVLLVASAVGCAAETDEHPSTYQYEASPDGSANPVDPCATPNEGCLCSEVGQIVDCGRVTVQVGDYKTCYEGSRLCSDDGVWGACVADQTIVQLTR